MCLEAKRKEKRVYVILLPDRTCSPLKLRKYNIVLFLLMLSFQDFGEYQESYYSVQTTEGEQISQLIAGYIDIILKKVFHTDARWKSCCFRTLNDVAPWVGRVEPNLNCLIHEFNISVQITCVCSPSSQDPTRTCTLAAVHIYVFTAR